MRKQVIENAAFEVASTIRAVEDNLDATLEDLAALQSAMLRVRRVTGVSVATGQDAFVSLAETMQTLVAARSAIGKCHLDLKLSKKDIPVLRMSMIGEDDESVPIPKPSGAIVPGLKVVA